MANEIINAFAAIVTRLSAAQQSNGSLTGVHIVQGPTDAMIELRDLPYIEYHLESGGSLAPVHLGGIANHEINIIFNLLTAADDGYYTQAKTGGILWLYQALQNAIDCSPAGIKELTGGGTWRLAPKYSIGAPERVELGYKMSVTVTLSSCTYTRGKL